MGHTEPYQRTTATCSNVLCFLFGTSFLFVFIGLSDGRECLKDKELERYSVNIYHCNDPVKTECCEENRQPTCCEPDSSRNLREQLVLWGSVIGIVSVALMLLLCWKRDSYICEGATLKDRAKALCRCGKKGHVKFPEEEDGGENIEIETFKPIVMERTPTPCTNSMGNNSLKIDQKQSPPARGRASTMSRSMESPMSDESAEESSEDEVRKSPVKERRSWTLSDKLPPLVGARRPPTAEPLPSTSRMRPLNDIVL